MEALDTNVVVRLLVLDDEEQCRRAERLLTRALAARGAWLATTVLVETVWVLRIAYKFDRATTAAAIRRLLSVQGILTEDQETIEHSLQAFEAGAADFADYVILERSKRAGAIPLWTFDEQLSTADGAELVPES